LPTSTSASLLPSKPDAGRTAFGSPLKAQTALIKSNSGVELLYVLQVNELVSGKPLPGLQHVEHLLLNLIEGQLPLLLQVFSLVRLIRNA
jgi:hypothetical protein